MKDELPFSGPVLYAHRGAPLEAPENSLQGYERALEVGADALEIDVHVTRDGHVVVAHDASGLRTAGVARQISACDLIEIKRWDLARPFAGTASSAPVCVPTLDEVLEAFPSVRLNVDVKAWHSGAAERVLAVVARHDAAPRVLLTSFSSAVTRRIRRLGYPGPTGFGRAEVAALVFAPAALLARTRVAGARVQIPPRYAALALDRPALVRKLHALGLAVDYWVVNERAQAEQLLALGADGIVTDDPRAMAELFAHSPYTGAWRGRHRAHDAPR